ncbi:hypothetical protein ABZ746_36805 [Streptomyces sp. NPDC020096]
MSFRTAQDADPHTDGVVYRQAAVWLTEEEHVVMIEEIERAVLARVGHDRDDGRTRHIVSLVVVPDKPATKPGPDADTEQ